jgi:transcriptional regulator with XRE-family HTH domain
MKLLIQYDNAELTTGQVAEKLGISKSEVLELLKKHNIPYIRADEEYIKQEFEAFEDKKSVTKKGNVANFLANFPKIDLVNMSENSINEYEAEDSLADSKRVQSYLENYIKFLKIEISELENNEINSKSIEKLEKKIEQVKKDFLFDVQWY